jgi:hypothetical protein
MYRGEAHLPACTQKGASVTNGAPVYNQTIGIDWVKCGNNYGGRISGPYGNIPSDGSIAWAPGSPHIGIFSGETAKDSTRIRVDIAQNVNWHGF